MNTHDIFDFLSNKVGGGHFLCGPHRAEKWGGGRVPRPPTDLRPCTESARLGIEPERFGTESALVT